MDEKGDGCVRVRGRRRGTLSIPIRLVRTACIAVPAAGGLLFLMFLTGIGGERGGWLWAPMVSAPTAAAVGWFGFGRHGGRVAVTAILALGGVAFGTWMSQESVLSHERLRTAMDSLSVPSSFDTIEDTQVGSSLCFDECSSYGRSWIAPGSRDDVQAALTEGLQEQDFVLEPWRSKVGRTTVIEGHGHRGRLGVVVGLDAEWAERSGQRIPLEPGQVWVTIRTRATSAPRGSPATGGAAGYPSSSSAALVSSPCG